MTDASKGVVWAGLTAALALVGGCSTARFDVDVTVVPDLRDQSLEVHLVGVNQPDYEQMTSYSMTKYWEPGNPLRAGLAREGQAFVMKFGVGQPPEQRLARSGAIWKKWSARGARYLFVLAHLPGRHDDKDGGADDRRVVLPLDPRLWSAYYWGSQTIPVRISAAKIDILRTYKLPE